MTIENDFRDLMTQTVAIEKFISHNANVEPTYGDSANHRARVVHKEKVVRDTQGREKVSTAQTWIFGNPDIDPQDRITLPDESQPIILSVRSYPDENGDHHQVVFT